MALQKTHVPEGLTQKAAFLAADPNCTAALAAMVWVMVYLRRNFKKAGHAS